MRVAATLATLVAMGCASSPGTVGSTRPTTQDISTGGIGGTSRLTVTSSSGPTTMAMEFAPDQIWKVLPAVFDSIGVPVNHLDPASKTIGNDGFKARQRLGNTRMSLYFDCGTTQIGPNADSYDMYITVLVKVQPAGSASRLVANIEASSRPITFSQAYSRCNSRGKLEERIGDLIRAQIR